jgi:hypothetical protein
MKDSTFMKYITEVGHKKVTFELPKWYILSEFKNRPKSMRYIDNDDVRYSSLFFLSAKNENNYCVIHFFDSLWYEHISDVGFLDSLIYWYCRRYYEYEIYGTVFTEKGIDKNKNSFYYFMASARFRTPPWQTISDDDRFVPDSIETSFRKVILCPKELFYIHIASIESVEEFSYEEKRKILESFEVK